MRICSLFVRGIVMCLMYNWEKILIDLEDVRRFVEIVLIVVMFVKVYVMFVIYFIRNLSVWKYVLNCVLMDISVDLFVIFM